MTVEPEQVTTVSRRPLTHFGDSDEKVYADAAARYRDNLIRRFGKVPSWSELAKRENDARDRKEQAYQPQTALVGSLDRRRAKTAELMNTLVATVTHPMTSQDIATATKTPYATVCWMMARAMEEGRVDREKAHGLNIWMPLKIEADDEPEQPEPIKGISPEPIKVPVRGMEFASLRACARHFGISVQAVSNAVKRGRTDMIGLRKRMEAAE